MGFVRIQKPARLDLYSPFDGAVDNDATVLKYGDWNGFFKAVAENPGSLDVFCLKQGEKLAKWRFRFPTAEDMIAIRDEAMRYTKSGSRYSSRYQENFSLAFFRNLLVEVRGLFPADEIKDFGGEAPQEGEAAKGKLSEVFDCVDIMAQTNLGRALQTMIEAATEKQGK